MTACRVKSFKLDDRDMVKNEEANVKKKLMLEDGLEDLENLLSDLDKDAIGAKYLRMSNSVSFDKMCSYVIELPISEHWHPDVKLAKRNELKNLRDYETFQEVEDNKQEMIRSP